jgi:hypothetical protein
MWVCVDETMWNHMSVGATHRDYKNTSLHNRQQWLLGAIAKQERGQPPQIRVHLIRNRTAQEVVTILKSWIPKGTLVIVDGASIYTAWAKDPDYTVLSFKHSEHKEIIRKNLGATNPIEGLWSSMKRDMVKMYSCLPGGEADNGSFCLEMAWRRVNAWFFNRMVIEDQEMKAYNKWITERLRFTLSLTAEPEHQNATSMLKNLSHGQEAGLNNIDLVANPQPRRRT